MSAPFIGLTRNPVFRFRLGDFEVTVFQDGVAGRDDPGPRFAADLPADKVAALLAAHRLPADRFENSYNVTIVNTGGKVVLFDTGIGATKRKGGFGFLHPLMAAHGPRPEEVDLVVLTHCHSDHIGGLIENGEPAFPNAEIVCGRTEFDYWMNGDVPESRRENHEWFMQLVAPFANRIRLIAPGDEVLPGIRAVAAFGHSPGHLAYLVESAGERLFVLGDVANHHVLSLHRPHGKFVMEYDGVEAGKTRARVLGMAAHEELLTASFHFPFPGLGYVDRDGDGYRFVPVTYQLSL